MMKNIILLFLLIHFCTTFTYSSSLQDNKEYRISLEELRSVVSKVRKPSECCPGGNFYFPATASGWQDFLDMNYRFPLTKDISLYQLHYIQAASTSHFRFYFHTKANSKNGYEDRYEEVFFAYPQLEEGSDELHGIHVVKYLSAANYHTETKEIHASSWYAYGDIHERTIHKMGNLDYGKRFFLTRVMADTIRNNDIQNIKLVFLPE